MNTIKLGNGISKTQFAVALIAARPRKCWNCEAPQLRSVNAPTGGTLNMCSACGNSYVTGEGETS